MQAIKPQSRRRRAQKAAPIHDAPPPSHKGGSCRPALLNLILITGDCECRVGVMGLEKKTNY